MRKFLLLLAVAAALSSCNLFGGKRVSGSGKITVQDRKVSSFNSIEASGSVKVHIRQDSSSSVRIETDENLMEYVDVYTTGSTLVIKEKDGFNLDPSKDLIVYTSAPVYESVDVSGSGDIISDNIISGGEPLEMGVSGSGMINVQVALPKVSVDVSGSGDVILKGTSKEFSGSISGSGSIKAFDLTTDVTLLRLSGAADAEVTANQKLDVSVSGSGDVKYKGSATVSQSISGSGSVKKVS
jgi:biopolymer transport protein ExbD